MVSDVFYMEDDSRFKAQFLKMYNPNSSDMLKMYQEAT